MDTTTDRDALGAKLLPELQQIARSLGVEGAQKLRKAGLIDAIVASSNNGDGDGAGGNGDPGRRPRRVAAKTSNDEGEGDGAAVGTMTAVESPSTPATQPGGGGDERGRSGDDAGRG